MDRRMLLAMALAVLVLVVNSVLFGNRRPKESLPTSADTTFVAPERPVLIPAPPGQQVGRLPGAAVLRNAGGDPDLGGTIDVETDLVQAEFDPVGGTLRSWKLLKYTDADDDLADLVRDRNRGAIYIALRDNGMPIRTDSTRFHAAVSREADATIVRFTAADGMGIEVEKTYTIPNGRYDCRLDIVVRGLGSEGEGSALEIGWTDGMPILEKDRRTDHAAISAVALFGKDFIRTHAGGGVFGCAGGGGGVKTETTEGTLRWLGVRNRYFLGALLLDQPRDRRVQSRYDGTTHEASAILTEPLSMSGVTEVGYRLYLGPINYGVLERYGVGLERVQDLGPGVFRPFSKLLMKFFEAANRVIPNYGWEIIILSVLLRILFYPLTKKSMDSMKRMQQLKPEMDRINEKHKDDPAKRNQEIMELYRKYKINPLGSCLPMLIQLPVLSGLYFVLANAVQLRKEPFGLWMTDLSAPDTVAHLAGFPVNILPLIMAGTMVWQQKITPTDPRQAALGYLMPIMMTFLFYSMASGLVLYWTISNLMTVLQQAWMNRTPLPPLVAQEVPRSDRSGQGRRGR